MNDAASNTSQDNFQLLTTTDADHRGTPTPAAGKGVAHTAKPLLQHASSTAGPPPCLWLSPRAVEPWARQADHRAHTSQVAATGRSARHLAPPAQHIHQPTKSPTTERHTQPAPARHVHVPRLHVQSYNVNGNWPGRGTGPGALPGRGHTGSRGAPHVLLRAGRTQGQPPQLCCEDCTCCWLR